MIPVERGWKGLPFRAISEFYQAKFGGRTVKMPVAVAGDCPNRRGLRGMQTCNFCDAWGSAARAEALTMDLEQQLTEFRKVFADKWGKIKILVYFQAYTSTFQDLKSLRAAFERASQIEGLAGFVIGTRPDCVSPAVIDLWREFYDRTGFLSVELGLQSFRDEDLLFYRRGHTVAQSLKAIEKISRHPELDLGVHLMFGAPNEPLEVAQEAARRCNELPIHNVKLHNLHVLKGTPLADLWQAGDFTPVSLEDYTDRVAEFLAELRPDLYIHRLAAYSSRWDELLAPSWTSNKMRTHQHIVDELRRREIVQSLRYESAHQNLERLRSELLQRRFKIATDQQIQL